MPNHSQISVYQSQLTTEPQISLVIPIVFVRIFPLRLRFFIQLEDELQSLQHSQQWLEEKGSQLAQKDSELAGEALREVALVKSVWDDVRTAITNG